ncbi:hypothetical protein [Geosporobacter ferrireducens]|uniref:Uncharacterized protein n=1 Tax=Geosporobacter ferrireducens TaxID=1424294 RepID=A0A1D8GDN3_9FIRM|nr:hypothetical protein [Geosporobacter ferrireducens]AOT69006.1 hypothetical protein Gferi_05205 [Geosporobacter ferrireducens]
MENIKSDGTYKEVLYRQLLQPIFQQLCAGETLVEACTTLIGNTYASELYALSIKQHEILKQLGYEIKRVTISPTKGTITIIVK